MNQRELYYKERKRREVNTAPAETAWHLVHTANQAFDLIQSGIEERNDLDAIRDTEAEDESYHQRVELIEARIATARRNFELLTAMAAPAMTIVDTPFSADALETRKLERAEALEEEARRRANIEGVFNIYSDMSSRADRLIEEESEVYRRVTSVIDEAFEGEREEETELIRFIVQSTKNKSETYQEASEKFNIPLKYMEQRVRKVSHRLVFHNETLDALLANMEIDDIADHLPPKKRSRISYDFSNCRFTFPRTRKARPSSGTTEL